MRLRKHPLPFGVSSEVCPRLSALVVIFKRDQVDKLVVRRSDIVDPVSNVLDAVFLKQRHRVVGEAVVQVVQLAAEARVDAKLVDHAPMSKVCSGVRSSLG